VPRPLVDKNKIEQEVFGMLRHGLPTALTRKLLCALNLAALVLALTMAAQPAAAAKKDKFRVAWSIYVGWMPWAYAADKGIVEKWAKKYGIEIEVVQINDYIESINQ
jgi:NitT/TauT family transport system substrate-binding protein